MNETVSGRPQARMPDRATPLTPPKVEQAAEQVARPAPPPSRADNSQRAPLRPSHERHVLRGPEEYPMEDLAGTKFHIEKPIPPGKHPRFPAGIKGDYPDGFDLQWVAVSIWEQHQPQIEADYTRKGWQQVYNGDFENRYRGRWIPYPDEGPIQCEGLALMARPMSWSDKSREAASREAYNQVAIKVNQLRQGELEAVTMDPRHKTALNFNHVNVSVEGVTIPSAPDK